MNDTAPAAAEKSTGKRPLSTDQARAREAYGIDPRRCLIRGYDTSDGMEHALVRSDVGGPAKPEMVGSFRKHGQIQPCRARKLPESDPMFAKGFVCEIGVGRERCKVGRVLIDENPKFLLDVKLYPVGTTDAELLGIANAENHHRKVESFSTKVEHMFQQFRMEGGDDAAIQSVAVDFDVSPLHVRQCLAFRGAADVRTAHEAGKIGDAVALTLASLPDGIRATELAAALASDGSTVEVVRERSNRAKKVAKAAEADLAAAAAVMPGDEPATDAVSSPTFEQITNGTAAAARKASTAPKPATKSGADVAISLSKGTISRLAGLEKSTLSTEVRAFLDVLAGKQPPTTVDGLPEALRALGLID